MTDRIESPHDSDAWAHACAEDLAAEKARRKAQYGAQPGTAAEELRRLFDTVAERFAGPATRVAGAAAAGAATSAAQEMARQFVVTARQATEALVERNPELFDHLAAAKEELVAAYRAAVQRDEARWTKDEPDGGAERIDLD
ncbi:DUF5304 family protein [Streptomyces sp. NPDC051940]|uniref:DUF5304 family protein n=1 Tax=Streptomyces sp. NPDC051940 TaxID=3155675 RepID=UPI003412A854